MNIHLRKFSNTAYPIGYTFLVCSFTMFLFVSRFFSCSACADVLGRESRGGQPLGLLGIFSVVATMRLEKSPNRLRYFPLVGNIRTCASMDLSPYPSGMLQRCNGRMD
jgi:hypothetical protein